MLTIKDEFSSFFFPSVYKDYITGIYIFIFISKNPHNETTRWFPIQNLELTLAM